CPQLVHFDDAPAAGEGLGEAGVGRKIPSQLVGRGEPPKGSARMVQMDQDTGAEVLQLRMRGLWFFDENLNEIWQFPGYSGWGGASAIFAVQLAGSDPAGLMGGAISFNSLSDISIVYRSGLVREGPGLF